MNDMNSNDLKSVIIELFVSMSLLFRVLNIFVRLFSNWQFSAFLLSLSRFLMEIAYSA
jgi:hypothetical protein